MAKNNFSFVAGRLVKDAAYKKTQNSAVCNFTLAVERDKKPDQDSVSDFPQIVVWGKNAEKAKDLRKGDVVAVLGAIQTRKYEGRNGTVYVTEINCERVFLDGIKKPAANTGDDIFGDSDEGFVPVDDFGGDDPF